MIQLIVNGQATTTEVTHLHALLQELQFDLASIATAIDGEFVPKARYAETVLHTGQKIEVLAPMQGG